MHYAEFAEDEVSNFVRLTAEPWARGLFVWLTGATERGAAASDQRLRKQQVESHWPEGGQAGQGKS